MTSGIYQKSEQHRKKISIALKGNKNSLGRIQSKETIKKISKSRLGVLNPIWKGNNVGYKALHQWLNRNHPKPDLCEECGVNPPYDLANITGIYDRDLINWKYICRKCHMIIDNRIEKAKKNLRFDHKRDPKTGRFLKCQ